MVERGLHHLELALVLLLQRDGAERGYAQERRYVRFRRDRLSRALLKQSCRHDDRVRRVQGVTCNQGFIAWGGYFDFKTERDEEFYILGSFPDETKKCRISPKYDIRMFLSLQLGQNTLLNVTPYDSYSYSRRYLKLPISVCMTITWGPRSLKNMLVNSFWQPQLLIHLCTTRFRLLRIHITDFCCFQTTAGVTMTHL